MAAAMTARITETRTVTTIVVFSMRKYGKKLPMFSSRNLPHPDLNDRVREDEREEPRDEAEGGGLPQHEQGEVPGSESNGAQDAVLARPLADAHCDRIAEDHHHNG